MDVKNICIFGSGLMGHGIAQVTAASGFTVFMRDREEKLSALNMLIEQLEEDPEPSKEKYINESSLDKVNMVSIKVKEMWGKRNI